MYEGSIEKTQEKCKHVNEVIKESLIKLNLKSLQVGDVIDYKSSFGTKDWNNLKESKCFNIIKDDNGERLIMKQECIDCQKILKEDKDIALEA